MSATTTDTTTGHWIAIGATGAVGSIHRNDDGYLVRMERDGRWRGVFGTLGAAKGALHAAMGPGADWPEFREH